MNVPIENTNGFSTRFCYRISKEAGMASNNETGENADCYLQFKVEHLIPMSEDKFNHMHQVSLRKGFAEQLDCSEEYVIPITEQEHDENVDPQEVAELAKKG